MGNPSKNLHRQFCFFWFLPFDSLHGVFVSLFISIMARRKVVKGFSDSCGGFLSFQGVKKKLCKQEPVNIEYYLRNNRGENAYMPLTDLPILVLISICSSVERVAQRGNCDAWLFKNLITSSSLA